MDEGEERGGEREEHYSNVRGKGSKGGGGGGEEKKAVQHRKKTIFS